MGRTLYLQCDNGISGDMVVGALLDLGASESGLRTALQSLDLAGYEIRVTRKLAGALDACDFDVVVDEAHENHDHDMEWLFGGLEDAPEGMHHHGDHGHDHHHDHGHGHHGHHHHYEHRGLADITRIIEASELSREAKDRALKIFGVIAVAEAKAHGTTVEEVHFHEVGAVDSIVDVVSAAWCMEDLGVDDVVVSALGEGEGHVRSAHGVLPIPVPAVANIIEAHGLVVRRLHRKGEFVTPTGAAIAAAMRTQEELPEQYRIIATGIGTGKRDYNPPSMLRATLVETVAETVDHAAQLWKLETEVDDCTGEALGYVLDRLYDAGAREAHFLPVFMKKSRPGYQIEVLCDEQDIPVLESILFEDTTTIGIRRYPLARTALERSQDCVQTAYGEVVVKRVVLTNGESRSYPEHDDVARVAQEHGVGYQDVLRAVLSACR